MGTLGNMDGSFDGVLKASEQLKGLPKIIQKYMTAGIFQDELGWAKHFDDDSIDKLGGVDSFIVQIMNLDKAQQDALLSVSKFSDGLKEEIERLLQAARAGEKFNTQLFEQEASKDDKLSKGVLNEVMQTTGMKDADGNYLLPNTKDVCDLLEQYANDANNAQKAQELFNAGLLEQSDNGYKVSASLLKLIGAKKSDIVTTGIATAGQMAWNYAMQIGKQLLLSLGVAAVTFIATKLVDYIMNLKTHSEELVDAMNDSHDAAQQATKDVEEIQSKIDELNKSLKDAGVKKIEDIVDPTERERLQAINDMLQAQLELKKQLEKDANDKANADTSAVVNDKTEDSIVKSRTVNVSYAEGGANAGTHQVAEKVSKTESLEEHAAALNDLIDKRRELATAGKKDTQEYKDNEAAITAETEKVEGLSSAVSKQMDSYEIDADSFAKYKDEYVAGTNSITAATKALANANDDVGVTHQESALGKQLRIEQGQLNKATKAYKKYSELKEHYGKYGNIDNFNRGIIEWNDENLAKYSEYAKENGVHKGEYSTVNGASKGFEANGKEIQIAYTPMLQTDDGDVMPLTANTIEEYIWSCIDAASEMDGGATAENILKVDKEGIYEDIDGVETRIHGMIGAVEGQILNGAKLSALDVIAIAGATEEELGDEFGNQWSKYFGHSMHDIQSQAVDLCETIKNKWNDIWSDDVDTTKFNDQLSNSGNIQNALNLFGGSADAEYLKAIGQSGPKTKEQTEAFEILNKVAARLHTTYEKLIDAMEEEGIVASQSAVDTTAMSEASSKLDEVQAAYKSLRDAQKEYNKQSYLTADTLQSILDLDPKYQACLVEENGKLNINKGTIKNLTNSYYELMKAKVYSQAIDDLKEMDTYQKAVDFLGQAKQETKDWLSLMQATANVTLETSGLSGEGWDKLNEAQQARIKTAQTMVDLIAQTQSQSLDKQFPDSSTSKSTKNTKTAIDAWSTLTSAMKEYNEQGYITFQTLKSLTDLEDKYSSMLRKNDVTGQLEMRTNDFYKLMKAELKEAQIKGDGASEAQYNKILKWTNRNIKDQTMSYWDLVAAIEGYSSALSEAKEITDGFKSAWDNGKTVKQKTEKSRTGALDYEGTEAQSSALQDMLKYSEYDPTLIEKAYNKETGKIDLSGDMLKTAVVASLREQAKAARTEGGAAADAIAASYEKSANNIEGDVISVQDYFDGLGSTIDEIDEKIDDMQSA